MNENHEKSKDGVRRDCCATVLRAHCGNCGDYKFEIFADGSIKCSNCGCVPYSVPQSKLRGGFTA